MDLVIRSLDAKVDRSAFDSGVPALDQWFEQQAGQAQRKRLASVWVASPEPAPNEIVGYYSLAPLQIGFEDAPEPLRRRLPRYPLAVTLIARLAVDRASQGKGVGRRLLADALGRALRAADVVPVQAVVVHAKDEKAAAFYRAFGFVPFDARPLQLYMPIASIAVAP